MNYRNYNISMYANKVNKDYRISLFNYYSNKALGNTLKENVFKFNLSILKVESKFLSLFKRIFLIFDDLELEEQNNYMEMYNIIIEIDALREEFLNCNLNEGRTLLNEIQLEDIDNKIDLLTSYLESYIRERS